MKTVIITTIILLSISINISAQIYRITYIEKLKYNSKLFASTELAETDNIITKELENEGEKYTLTHQNGISVYQLEGSQSATNEKAIATFYKNFEKNEVTQINTILAENEAVRDEMTDEFYWIITDETQTINGYLCKKAVRMDIKNFEAWFTEEIPISDGPSSYCGLPGLILKTYLKNSSYESLVEVDEIEILEGSNEKIEIPEREKFITEAELQRLILKRL